MAKYLVSSEDLTSIADAIRAKTHTTLPIAFPETYISKIEEIKTGNATNVTYSFCYRNLVTYRNIDALDIRSYAFCYCTQLQEAYFTKCSCINQYAFASTTSLNSLYMLSASVANLKTNVFSNSKLTSTAGTIYVPATLLNSYKTATNWAYYSTRFSGV